MPLNSILKTRKFITLSNVIRKFDGFDIKGEKIQFEPNWNKGLGRIRLFMKIETPIDAILLISKQFIDLTFKEIDSNIAKVSDANLMNDQIDSINPLNR